MKPVESCALPEHALLRRYEGGKGFADCYVTDVPGHVSQPAFTEAFYTTPLFKLERALLAQLASRPSSDSDARQLAEGSSTTFAAWRVEDRNAQQLLMADFTGRTRSWLMVEPVDGPGAPPLTRLYFGSAVVARVDARSGKRGMGVAFHALLGFHKLYSRLLLGAARSRVLKQLQQPA